MAYRILVIDDEPRLAHSLSALLRGLGYEVEEAIGGHAGMSRLQNGEYDLVITDLRMDGVDGFDIMRFLSAERPAVPIIVITGHASTESAIEAIHQNVYDYIPKPFDFDLLRTSVEKAFARIEAARLKQDMVHMLTHDIKVPLTSILGFAEFLAAPNGLASAKAPDHLRKILGNANKVIALLENYLTNARYEEGRLEVTRIPISVRDLAGDVARMLEPESVSKGIPIENRVPEDLRASLDEHLMFRALANLVNNAVKYSPAGSAITIEAEENSVSGHPEILLRVTNTGVALTPAECDAVFRRYQRGRTSRGTSGWGLGLHVVRCVAEAHGGTVTCTSDAARPCVAFSMAVPHV